MNKQDIGYPFIRSNWKPRFTIASISQRIISQISSKNLKKLKLKKNNTSTSHLYQIKKNNHKFWQNRYKIKTLFIDTYNLAKVRFKNIVILLQNH